MPEAILLFLFTCPLTNTETISWQLSNALTFPLLSLQGKAAKTRPINSKQNFADNAANTSILSARLDVEILKQRLIKTQVLVPNICPTTSWTRSVSFLLNLHYQQRLSAPLPANSKCPWRSCKTCLSQLPGWLSIRRTDRLTKSILSELGIPC